MPKKKTSPIVQMTGQILDEIQEHNVLVRGHKDHFVSLLRKIEWSLVKSGTFANPHSAQALGYTRGALAMFGIEPTS